MIRYNKIRKMDIANGPGVRVSIFLQGCTFHCPDCFNPETHDFNGGYELTDEVLQHLMQLCGADHIKGLSILGGEPLHPKNIEGTTQIAKMFKEKFPNKSLWLWTGFLYENIKEREIFNYIDVLVDGLFDKKLANPMLQYRGSSNQRLIDIAKTLQSNEIILWNKEKK